MKLATGPNDDQQRSEHDSEKEKPKRTPRDIFPDVQPNQFSLCFVEISHGENKHGIRHSLKKPAWSAFQHEIGQRFDMKLAQSVSSAVQNVFDNTFAYHGDNHGANILKPLGKLVSTVPRSRHGVLIVAVPNNMPSTAVSEIKRHYDLVLGLQCNIVSADEINARWNPQIPDEMVKYTGGIVRNIFARALIPAQDEYSTQQATINTVAAPGGRRGLGMIIGIHVVRLNTANVSDELGRLEAQKVQPTHFVTVVSTTTSRNASVNTTHHTHRAFTDTMVSPMACAYDAFLAHLDEAYPAQSRTMLSHMVVYQTGLDAKDARGLEGELEGMDQLNFGASQSTRLVDTRISLIATAPETIFSIPNAQSTIHVTDATSAVEPLSSKAGGQLRDVQALQAQLVNTSNMDTAALGRVYSRRPVQPPSNTWYVSYSQSVLQTDTAALFGASSAATHGNRKHTHHVSLEKRALPNILYLTEQASKRGRCHLRTATADDTTVTAELVSETVCQELQGSLYYW